MTEIEILLHELARTRATLNYFMDPLTHGLYPQRDLTHYTPATRFRGSAEDQIFQIFKIIDYEVRRLAEATRETGIDLNEIPLDYPAIFDDLSRATEITETGHSD
jgi:hypothetical protein